MYEYTASIRRVVDGDTIDVTIDLGFDVYINERVRLSGVDTPESRTRDLREKRYGKLATARVVELMPVGSSFVVRSSSYNSTGKYGRSMMDFELDDGRMLSRALVEERLAVPYNGENKRVIRVMHEANWDWLESK